MTSKILILIIANVLMSCSYFSSGKKETDDKKRSDETSNVKVSEEENNEHVDSESSLNQENLHKSKSVDQQLSHLTSNILNMFILGGTSSINKYVLQDSVVFFYWNIGTQSLSDSLYNLSVTLMNEQDETEQHVVYAKDLIDKMKNYKSDLISYKGKSFYPPAGFGGYSSVMPSDGESEIVVIPQNANDHYSNMLWFEFVATEDGYSLVELGYWEWSP